jgi:hypothetical protein
MRIPIGQICLGFVFVVSQRAMAADKPTKDLTAQFINKYNFSKQLMPTTEFLGFIDPKFQRMFIKFKSVTKDPSDPSVYLVKGTSKVKNNSCDFSGKIRVTEIEKINPMHYGVDDEYKDKGIKSEGVLHGDYEFAENEKQKYSGVFKGTMVMFWYVDHKSHLQLDDMEASYSDSYKNNQYAGTWTENGKILEKQANWGEYRIPNSGDLDIGAGEFGADPKYSESGW